MKDSLIHYYYKEMPDPNFCVDIFYREDKKTESRVNAHWHEHIQLYYFIQGKALLECNQKRIYAEPKSIVIINSNELHYMESFSDHLKYYVLRIDPSFLFSNQVDLCQTKYISPLSQNLITFQNLIQNDNQVLDCVNRTIQEYSEKKVGYELAVKSCIYQLIVLLLRGYINKILTKEEFAAKANHLKCFDPVFKYIQNNYSDKILIKDLADTVHISSCHFCRLFKQISGKTTTDYINGIRLDKAVVYLKEGNLNITEIALNCGFSDMNYFSRMFKKQYHCSPTSFRKMNLHSEF